MKPSSISKATLLILVCAVTKTLSFSPVSQLPPPKIRRGSTRIRAHPSQQGGVTFQYSPSSLLHLENIELPDNSLNQPWTPTKIKATAGALVGGILVGAAGEYGVQALFGEEKAFFVFGALGAAGGWFLCGGQDVQQEELPMNGGYDAKLIYDRPSRLKTVLEDLKESDCAIEQLNNDRDMSKVLDHIKAVHGEDYVSQVETKSRESDRPRRFNPLYVRTLMDQHTFDAAVNAVADWMDSVDGALSNNPRFALVRPPSHHACRNKAMGGCFFNSVAVAAIYALEQPGVNHVAILDIDAHHGNGIAHCIQDEPKIRYCSLHEAKSESYMTDRKISDKDPRTPDSTDHGPLDNICNINLPSKTTWNKGYQQALEKVALPFLLQDDPDVLLVAAGFDAMQSDSSSGLMLEPSDYKELGTLLYRNFGNRVAFGLEGGYCWKNHDLGRGLIEFVKPWQE